MKKLLLILSLTFNHAFASVEMWNKSYEFESDGEYNKATNEITLLEATFQDHELEKIRKAWLLYLDGDYNKSIKYYKKAIEINTKSIESRLGIILPLQAQYRWKEAKFHADIVLSMAPWNYTAYIKKLVSINGMMEWNNLEYHARELSNRYPVQSEPLLFLARAQANLDKQKEAIKTYSLVLLRNPNNSEAENYLNTNRIE